jgi:hypothetical protein
MTGRGSASRKTKWSASGFSAPKKTGMAAHENPHTTKLYDRTGDEITLDEVERITL